MLKPWGRIILLTLAVAVVYMFGRTLAQAHWPLAAGFTYAQWLAQDMKLCGPRALALLLYLALMYRHPSWRDWGWHGDAGGALGQSALWLLTAGSLVHDMGLHLGTMGSAAQITASLLSVVLIAVHEETAFRGLLFGSLDEYYEGRHTKRAAVLSSLAFTFWHLGIQPVEGWPYIFVFGLVACAARSAGAGLPWLVAAHILVDLPQMLTGPFVREVAAYELFLLGSLAMLGGVILSWVAMTPSDHEERMRELGLR